MDREKIVGYLSALTDAEYATLASEARAQPLTPLQQTRAVMDAKSSQLQQLTAKQDAAARAASWVRMPAQTEPDTEGE